MNHEDFLKLVPKLKKIPIAGDKAHLEMIPEIRKKMIAEKGSIRDSAREAGVMALFFPNLDHKTYLILILRKTYKGVHSGQIGFPGGKRELYDADLKATALRETYEEIGVRTGEIEVVRSLTKLYIPPSNFWIYPFVGYTESTPKFKRQENEVERLLYVSLEDFLSDKNRSLQTLSPSYLPELEVPAFTLAGQIVWGATAMALNELKYLVKSAI